MTAKTVQAACLLVKVGGKNYEVVLTHEQSLDLYNRAGQLCGGKVTLTPAAHHIDLHKRT